MTKHWKRKFFTLWGGQALSIISSSISQYALIWYLTDKTSSAAVLSLAMLAGRLPQGILFLFAGAFADRFDRRIVMMVSDGVVGLISLLLAGMAAQGDLSVGPILLVLALRSVGSAIHTPCIQAVTPLIVPPEFLVKCAAWSQSVFTASMLLSPALAAVCYGFFPLHWILLLDLAGAVLAIFGILAARLPVLKVGKSEQKLRIWQDTKEGFSVLKSHRWLWQLCCICGLFSLAFVPVSALFPLMSMQYFGGGTEAAAVVQTLFAAGALVGSLILGIWGGTKDKLVTMIPAMLSCGVVIFVAGLLPSSAFWVFVVLIGLVGLTGPFFNSLFMALVQNKVEPEYLGRVLGLIQAISTFAAPAGLVVTSIFADQIGISVWFLFSGCVIFACGLLTNMLPSVRNCDREEIDKA